MDSADLLAFDEFVPRLGIVDDQGRISNLAEPHPEQAAIWDALNSDRHFICVLKPRQIGCTTAVIAWMFWRGYTSPDPLGFLSITHESGAVGRINKMLRNFWRSLPTCLRPSLDPLNGKEIGFGHNQAAFRQLMAGGRGQARSFTYQMFHATEAGLWPQGSAVMKGNALDEDIWGSTLSTMHKGENYKVIVESTGNGPEGLFYKLVKLSRVNPEWTFLFFPWTEFEEYRREPGPGWTRTVEEEELATEYGLTDEQLAWRRYKLEVEGYDIVRFKREYPLTWMEPFLHATGMWFDLEVLNRIAGAVPPENHRSDDLLIFYEYEPGRDYYIGVDTSGGVGKDFAVVCVLRDDLEQVAVWRSNRVKPSGQAKKAVELSIRYGSRGPSGRKARILCELNNYGEAVIKAMQKLGARLWRNPQTGKHFWTQGGRAGRTKKLIYDWAAEVVDGRFVGLNCPTTIAELCTIREQDNGNIEADAGGHDDHADACVLALWNAKTHRARGRRRVRTVREQRQMRHKQLMGQQ